MKILTVICFLSLFISIDAQTFFYDSNDKVTTKESAKYSMTIDSTKGIVIEKRYSSEDSVPYLIHYSLNRKLNGKYLKYYKSGKLHFDVDYKNGLLDGELKGYYENGNLRRLDSFKNNLFIKGNCYTIGGADTTYFTNMIMATFNNGDINSFRKYIQSILIYPEDEKRRKIQGKVLIEFYVNTKGGVEDVRLLKCPDELLGQAAKTAVLKSSAWKPSMIDGVEVKQKFSMPIIF